MSLFIVGAGIVTETISDFSYLLENQIQTFDVIKPKEHQADYLNQRWPFQSKALIAREDRALLNKIAQLSIDVSQQAMQMAETQRAYSEDEKQKFPIFSATEMVDHELFCLDKLLETHSNQPNQAIQALGEIKQTLNPLDMLRMLSTNPLYHLSKVFGLNGGGYPIRRMSLSSLSALELASFYLKNNQSQHGLVTSVGNLGMAENLTAFIKMNLLKTADTINGIIPAFGAASVILSTEQNKRIALAEILVVSSIYHNQNTITKDNWLALYRAIEDIKEPLAVIYYNNGVKALFEEEQKAVTARFPEAVCYSYKPYIGYTGKSNNLIDLIIALSDKRIPSNQLVLMNGVGTGVGLGCILMRKN